MSEAKEGTVFLSLNVNEVAREQYWSGSRQFHDSIEEGPSFSDASDAVEWWRSRGAKSILIRLNFNEYSWAGEGAPPRDGATMPIFDATDPRGRPEGARKTIEEHVAADVVRANADRAAAATEEGRRLSARRTSAELSVDELSDRIGTTSQWLLDVESGKSTFEVTLPQWINLVWATRPGWPHEMSKVEPRRIGWTARQGQFLAAAERIVDESIKREP